MIWIIGILITLQIAVHILIYFPLKDRFSNLEDRNTKEMKYLRSQLKIPEPLFHVKQSKKAYKPQVFKRTEEQEFERELPPSRSGEKTIGA